MPNQHSKTARSFMALVAGITWLALILQLYLQISNAGKNGLTPLVATWNFFSYFTILTNLLIAVSLTMILTKPHSKAGRFFSTPPCLSAITLYIFIVGLVYNMVLRFTWAPIGLQRWVDEALHVITPLFFIIFWIVFVPRGALKWIHPLQWLLYPLLYLLYALLRGELTGFYSYPFINTSVLGYNRVLMNAGGLMVLFVAAGLLLVGADKLMSRTKSRVLS